MANFPIGADTSQANQGIDRLITQLTRLGKQAGMSQAEIDKMVAATSKAKTDGVSNFNALGKSMDGMNEIARKGTELIAAYFAIDKIKDFVGEVVKVTAEFQRLEAVLTNTLGNGTAARAALADIQKLAAVTPFSVRELSDSFIKLANRGVKPTMDEMKRMGDLAATLGKPFEQLVEALLDINNQERWKEIGVKAETMGDKVKLSFKGVTYEVDRTVQGVTNAAVKLGQLNGVAGSMDAISKTLGGQISNLGDSWETFLKTVGDGNKGVLSGVVSVFSDILNGMTAIARTADQFASERVSSRYTNSKEYVDQLISQGMTSDKAGTIEQANIERRIQEKVDQLANARSKYYDAAANGADVDSLKDQKKKLEAIEQEIKDYQEVYKAVVNYTVSLHEEHNMKMKQDAEIAKKKAQEDEIARWKKIADWLHEVNQAMEINERFYKKHVDDIPSVKKGALAKVPGVDDSNISMDITNTKGSGAGTYDPVAADLAQYEARQQALASFKQYSIQAMGEIFAFNQQNIQNEMTALTNRYNYELGLAGTNKDAQQKLQNNYNKQMMKLQNQQAEAQKEQAIFGILVNEGPAIAKAIATAPWPINLGIGAAVAIMFETILAKSKSQQVPRFAEGKYGINGPGTETSDSIPTLLSKNESVASAKVSRKFKDVLQPMIEDKAFEWGDLRQIVDARMPELKAPMILVMPPVRDDGQLIEKMDEVKKAIANKKEWHLEITEKGLKMFAHEGNQWTEYVQKRYRMN